MSAPTPQQIAEHDQAWAEVDTRLNLLVEASREARLTLPREVVRAASAANFQAGDSDTVAAILAAAIIRLTEKGTGR